LAAITPASSAVAITEPFGVVPARTWSSVSRLHVNVPEAVKPLFRREMDGFSVLFHQASFGTVGFSTLQSRAFAGQIEDTFLFCLPGSTGACRDGWDLVLKHELDSRYRPCSLAGQVPRLRHLCA
jgi:molybdenum cofactor biosynthesis protein B